MGYCEEGGRTHNAGRRLIQWPVWENSRDILRKIERVWARKGAPAQENHSSGGGGRGLLGQAAKNWVPLSFRQPTETLLFVWIFSTTLWGDHWGLPLQVNTQKLRDLKSPTSSPTALRWCRVSNVWLTPKSLLCSAFPKGHTTVGVEGFPQVLPKGQELWEQTNINSLLA